jgi:hypothetical protein
MPPMVIISVGGAIGMPPAAAGAEHADGAQADGATEALEPERVRHHRPPSEGPHRARHADCGDRAAVTALPGRIAAASLPDLVGDPFDALAVRRPNESKLDDL